MAEWNIQTFTLSHIINQSLNEGEKNAQNCIVNFNHYAKIVTDTTANRYASACVSVPINATNIFVKQIHIDANYAVCLVLTGTEIVYIVPSGDHGMIKLTCNAFFGISDRELSSTITKSDFLNSNFALIPVIKEHMILDKRIFDINANFQTRSQKVYLNAFIDAQIDYYGHPASSWATNFDSAYASGNMFINTIIR